MKDDSGISIFLGLAFLLFYLFINKQSKKKKMEEEISYPPSKPHVQEKKVQPIKPSNIKREVFIERTQEENQASSAYDIIKTKKSSVLQPGWNQKSSLRQAFILSEVFKKIDDR